jgi:hypothetical protein
MGDYVRRKLSGRNIVEIVENCRNALLKGYLDDAEWERECIEKVVRMRDFEQFKKERRRANEEYDRFCDYLEELLPQIESMKDYIEKLRIIKPLYEKALEYDGKRRCYDRGLNDAFGETILVYHIKLMEDLLREIGEENLLLDIINGYEFEAFRIEMMKDFISIIYYLPPHLKSKPQLSLSDISSLDENVRRQIEEIARKYTHSNLENAINRLNHYLIFAGKEKEILEDLESKRHERIEKRKRAISKIEKKLKDKGMIEKFNRLLAIIDELTYYNIYEDEVRHTTLKELADYFLREELAKTLYELKLIPTPNPMDYPQRFLLRKCEEFLDKVDKHY